MAHWEQHEFVKQVRDALPQYFQGGRILEIGSGAIGGSVRNLFANSDYTGVDLASGPGVDRICPGQEISEPTHAFDVTISCECFEHNPFWLETFVNMLRLTRPGGLVVMTCALTGRQEHGTARMDPEATLAEHSEYKNYYRNLSTADFLRHIDFSRHFADWMFHENIYHKDLYFVGVRKSDPPLDVKAPMQALRASVPSIRRKKPLSASGAAAAQVKYQIKKGIVKIIGERGFHNLKFSLRQLLKRGAVAAAGEERVEKYRQARKQQDKNADG